MVLWESAISSMFFRETFGSSIHISDVCVVERQMCAVREKVLAFLLKKMYDDASYSKILYGRNVDHGA